MANNDRIFKPRRGTKSNFTNTELEGNKSNIVLDTGEVFFEVPDTGQGTGRVRVKMGDGITEYSSLPYAIPFTEDEIIIHDGTDTKTINASSIQSSSIATNLNNAKSGNTLKNIIHNLREAIYKAACDISYLDNKRSYVGMIIYSTKLDTSSKVISQYGGTAWIQLSDYILRGATSGVTANSNSKDGGSDDAIVVSHSHTTPNHSHTFTGTSKNYTSDGISKDHSHTIGGGGHWINSAGNHQHDERYGGSYWVDINGTGVSTLGATVTYAGNQNQKICSTQPAGDHQHYSPDHSHTCSGVSSNHTHTTTIKPEGSIGNASPTTNSTGSSGTNANLPNYKNVYIWERTA